MQLQKLPFAIGYVPDQYKTQQMCDKGMVKHSSLFLTATNIKKCVTK